MFYSNFEVTFSPTKCLTSEQIYNWFAGILKKRGQSVWRKNGNKWSHVVGRINLHTGMWKHRDQPLVVSPMQSAPPLSVKVQRKLF